MIKIKKLPRSRWKEYRDLRLESLKNDPIAFCSSYEEEMKLSETEWRKRIKNILFAFFDDTLAGMMGYTFGNKSKTKHISNIFGFYVKQEYRNQGIGKKLIESAFSLIMKNKDIIKVGLCVNSKQKAAIELYKRYGFKIVGRLKRDLFVNGKFYDELIMEKHMISNQNPK